MTSTATPLAPRLLNDSTWQDRAVCRGIDDPDIFFPGPDDIATTIEALRMCRWCAVRRPCLQAALEADDRCGIRGGRTEEEREPLHEDFQSRTRRPYIAAALAGRDVYLTHAERRLIVTIAYERDLGSVTLARILRVERDYATTLLRRKRRLRQQEAALQAHQPTAVAQAQEEEAA